jgi:hypothetical protein
MPGCSYDSHFGLWEVDAQRQRRRTELSDGQLASSQPWSMALNSTEMMYSPRAGSWHSEETLQHTETTRRESPCGIKLRCPGRCGYVPNGMDGCSSTCDTEREALPVNMALIHHPDLHLLPNAQKPLDQGFFDLNVQRYCLRVNC